MVIIAAVFFFALLSGITSMSGEGNFTRVGIKGFGAYILTAVFAVAIGQLGMLFKPGSRKRFDLNAILESGNHVAQLASKEPPSIVDFLIG